MTSLEFDLDSLFGWTGVAIYTWVISAVLAYIVAPRTRRIEFVVITVLVLGPLGVGFAAIAQPREQHDPARETLQGHRAAERAARGRPLARSSRATPKSAAAEAAAAEAFAAPDQDVNHAPVPAQWAGPATTNTEAPPLQRTAPGTAAPTEAPPLPWEAFPGSSGGGAGSGR